MKAKYFTRFERIVLARQEMMLNEYKSAIAKGKSATKAKELAKTVSIAYDIIKPFKETDPRYAFSECRWPEE